MEPLYKSFRDYIESGEYFIDAQKWYRYKYIYPFSQRSFVIILSVIICSLFAGTFISIRTLFPLTTQVKYSVNAETSAKKTAQIIRASNINNDPIKAITEIMCQHYVEQREKYNYDALKNQFIYIKNNSTRIAFRRFYNSMSIDNPDSPVLKYQKNTKRDVNIISSKFITNNKMQVKFRSIATNDTSEIIEDMLWLATLEYEIDQIDSSLPSGSRFNFTVTNYQLKLLQNKKK